MPKQTAREAIHERARQCGWTVTTYGLAGDRDRIARGDRFMIVMYLGNGSVCFLECSWLAWQQVPSTGKRATILTFLGDQPVMTVPETGGRRTEYLHERDGWIPCTLMTPVTNELHVVDLGMHPAMWRRDVPADRIRFKD